MIYQEKGIIKSKSIIKVYEKLNLLEEIVQDDIEHIGGSADAKIGYKTSYTSFFGYKTDLSMTEERIMTAATVTSGEKMMESNWKVCIVKVKIQKWRLTQS